MESVKYDDTGSRSCPYSEPDTNLHSIGSILLHQGSVP
jgi:hypothetical protein